MYSLKVQVAKAVASVRRCAHPPQPLLLYDMICIKISCNVRMLSTVSAHLFAIAKAREKQIVAKKIVRVRLESP